MKQIIKISSPNNETMKSFFNLRDKKTRNKEQKFLIEGYHLIEEASKTNYLECVITSDEKMIGQFQDILVYYVTDVIIKRLSSTKNPQPIVGVVNMHNYSINDLKNMIKKDEVKMVILDNINDPGNLGTMIRTSAALGYDAIVMSNDCVDLYNEKVVRSTQGVLFKIPIVRGNLIDMIQLFKKSNIICYGTSLNKAYDLEKADKFSRFAICVGNEARGVRDEILSLMDYHIQIPMQNDVESLNVAVALGIIMYELKKIKNRFLEEFFLKTYFYFYSLNNKSV